jgi:predicted dehydrogenase
MNSRVFVIGVGKMGLAHLKVLSDLNVASLGAWAPSKKRQLEVEELGILFFSGDLDNAVKTFSPTHVVIASPVETLFFNTMKIIEYGIKNILVEKPLALDKNEGNTLLNLIKLYGVNLSVAYNRRNYSSIITALKLIEEADEIVESVYFEFNESWPFINGPEGKDLKVKNKWIMANSLHVIDTAFISVGLPLYSRSSFNRKDNDLNWHPTGSIFFGAGFTEKNIPFSYHANWKSPGSWGVEWMTKSARYIFKPMEKLKVIQKGSFETKEITFENKLDIKYKPGVYNQNKAFLLGDKSKLVSVEYAIKLINLASKLGGYK